MRLFKPNVDKMLAKRDVKGLIETLAYPGSKIRNAARDALTKIGIPAVDPLLTALNHQNAWVRVHAADALGDIGDRRAVEPLINLMEDEEALVRFNTANVLGQLCDPRAIQVLIPALTDKAAEVRTLAARALGNINDPQAVVPLIAALKDSDAEVREQAVEALGKIGGPAAEQALNNLERMKQKEQERGSLAEESPLPEVASLREVEIEAEEANAEIRSLIQKLSLKPRDQLELMHPEKMQSMSEISKLEQNAVKPLLEALDGVDMEARATIVSLLGQLKDKRAVLPIAKQLQHSSPMVRFEAVVALGKYPAQEIQKAQVEELLKQASNDADIDVRNKAKEILSRLGIQVSDSPWFTGANTWEQLVKAFIRLELSKPSSDYQGFTQRIQNFSAAERHGAWIRVAQEVESKTDTIRCYLEALHNDPDPGSVAWGWLNGQYDKSINALPPGSSKTLEVVDKLRCQYGPISN